ncbi:MAG: hypothetical protein M3R25_05475 [Bacteroidota bacterium]|nr:hypothetical protein [Bacteroidota bacterium]
MRKNLFFYLCMAVSMTFTISCKDDDDNNPPVVEPSLIKTINLDYDGTGADVEGWQFIYDATDRVTSIINTYNGTVEDTILYDYSSTGKLIITKGGNPTTYTLDADGRVSKELWVSDGSEYEGYTYNADGILSKIVEHYGGADHLKYDLTIANKVVTNRIRYEDDGTVREDREFSFTTGDNASNIQQIYAVDSEWKPVGGLFGEASEKLASGFVRHITADPLSTYGVSFTYTFDSENRPATITKNGTSSGGPYTEILSYSYYE